MKSFQVKFSIPFHTQTKIGDSKKSRVKDEISFSERRRRQK